MKKVLAVALVAAMIVTMLPVAALAEKTAMTPGTYTGSFQGVNDTVTVQVTVTADAITDVQVVSHQETPGIGAPLTNADNNEGLTPIAVIPGRIVEAQSLDVDTITGATLTSLSVIYAVQNALTQAGANAADWHTPVETEAQDVEMTADVIVVGGGGSGLAAAISAAQSGAESVIVVEKCGAVGGDTLVCGAIYNNPDPERQSLVTMTEATKATVEAGIAVTPVNDDHKALIDAVAAEWEEYKASGRTDLFDSVNWFTLQTYNGGDAVADLDLVKVLTNNAIAGFEWIQDLGMGFNAPIGQGAGSLWQRTHTSTMQMGTGFISTYVNNIAANDKIKLVTEVTVDELTVEDGAVVGAVGTGAHGGKYTFHANKGVVLATGGFSANGEMISEYNTSDKWAATDLSKVSTTNRKACSQGDGIKLALGAGADLYQMDQIQLLYLGNLVDGGLTKYPKRVVNGTDQEIFINKEGKRFVQEDGRRDQICLAALDQTDGMFYFLESADGDYEDIDTALSADGFSLRFLEEQGYIFVADTLDEMAEKLGMDAETLKATVAQFNASVDAGKDLDGFGRTLFTTKLENGPFVATPRVPCLHHTMGGVRIDTECRVLNANGEPIKGLVAAGEITGGIHGGNRLGGNAVVDTVVFGKLAGETICK